MAIPNKCSAITKPVNLRCAPTAPVRYDLRSGGLLCPCGKFLVMKGLKRMNYQEYAKDLLKRKNSLTSAYAALTGELETLEKERCGCKNGIVNTKDESPRRASFESRLVDLLSDIEDCRMRRSVVERELTKIEKGMNGLSDYYKDLLNGFFINRHTGVADELMGRWYRERSSLYRDRSKALEQFTRSVYGVLSL